MSQPINIEQEFKTWLSKQPESLQKGTVMTLYNAFIQDLFIEHFRVFNNIVNEFRKQ